MSLDGLKFLVDPGHGGSDVGAIGTLNGEDVYEKDLALLFAEAVAETLEDFGATVYLTRDDDSKVSIDDRWKLGQQKDVDGVISVHFNSAGSTAKGTETIYAGNRSQDKGFAQTIQREVVNSLGTRDRGVLKDSDTPRGSLGVLRYPSGGNYPRALIEVEFITNESALEDLGPTLDEAAGDFARGVRRAMLDYFQ
ncbi:N-acetylmuramoyl-L-alanine amidase family protein [Brevibacillus brevis]|uniref:N-acetylmuramoyl-L-alanine amidase family protein n=1 Tax=Brevibacillus brevis TaxID=1393 RepID=UPI0007D8C35F|nr:N-acetylmuramoyl-L-alanine amidase [Brevibacillus brevis]